MNEEQFMLELDKQAPNWFIDMADFRDLHTFTLQQIRSPDRIVDHTNALRTSTGRRLFICAIATHTFLKENQITL